MASIPLLRLSLLPLHSSPTRLKPYPTNLPPRFPHTLKSPFTISLPRLTTSPQPPRRTTTRMSYNSTPATDRLISTAVYLLPLFNALSYGHFLLAKYPTFAVALDPILPLLNLYRSTPYATFVAFFALYLIVARNRRFSSYVRFNAMQAVVLDVVLALPLLFQRIFTPGRTGYGYKWMVTGNNVVFVLVVCCFVYSVVSCILGLTPYLPFIGEAAIRQL